MIEANLNSSKCTQSKYNMIFQLRALTTQKNHHRLFINSGSSLGGVLLSQDPSVQVPSALEGLT
ncbi:hypothetical protein, partial [Paenibacillus sp. SAFN-054]|uniref:hypothetical protein n=1 Tax=Paenibacillus sp. SAFN-054 TaxID=3436865 RepID=UPI003F808AC6